MALDQVVDLPLVAKGLLEEVHGELASLFGDLLVVAGLRALQDGFRVRALDLHLVEKLEGQLSRFSTITHKSGGTWPRPRRSPSSLPSVHSLSYRFLRRETLLRKLFPISMATKAASAPLLP